MRPIAVYCRWAVRRRLRVNISAYVSLAILSTMAFMSIALNSISSVELSRLAASAGYAGQLTSATSILFILGITVSVVQTGILVSRLLRDRIHEFTLLASIGLSQSIITSMGTLEYLIHAAIGVGFGSAANAALVMALILIGGHRLEPRVLGPALCFSAIVPIVTVFPIAMLTLAKYSRNGGTTHG